ncbi:2-polyprenylphenol 6-hydroxylase [Anoxybacter fermentans]|uniref:2-polyprenylphenol 6-hydroxylase n=1 Tax=Anoxybacter fermentans TaxID=1323375 RepID=A0A3Q9HRX9_9FIRM|nr:2-polyprenylphenol 6-hydroxylase [Anoxybacter fermentans]AZR74240.1 2-polyprenylphenol 6-hydroxylase [Anoxybacter fermentans]
MIRKIGLINRTYPHIKRYREIITVLVKHGFGDLITKTNLEKYIDFGKKLLPGKRNAHIVSLSRWERIRMVLEELGPTFIKFGQIMSNRPDLLPQELLVELEKLQDSVPPFSEEDARQLIEEELGKPISNLFKEFISTPIASASIAQVHKAVLMSGEEVVLKVQRPGIEEIIEVDLEIMFHLATLMEKHIQGMDVLNPVGIIKEFERSIRKEIDFTIEATHIERFGRNFQEDTTIYVPKVYRNYTTRKILTMEFIDGIKVSNINAVLESGNDPKIIANRGADLILKQIFEHGFFHADPHPGNILVLNNNIICFIDFGMMGFLLPKHREYLGNIIIGVVNRDTKRITKTLLQFSRNNRIEDIEGLEYQIFELVEQYSYLPLKDINMGELLNKIIKIILAYKLKIPPDIYLLSKALVTIEGVGRKLDPDFDMVKHVEPFAKKLLKERLSPRKLTKDIYLSATEFGLLFHDLPSEIREIIEQIKYGQVKIEHKGLEPMLKKHDQISNRIAFAIVLASLIIGSSLIVLSEIPPKWNGIPIIGIVGFLGAGIMGFWLLISILRHGKM